MAGGIKGITVKIGGDTTELGRALNDASKQSSSLQKELKGVNSLLKFDPSNVDLLRQKSDLLKKSIEETEKKQKALNDVLKQVDSGEVEMTEEEYRNLQREIANTGNKLDDLKDQMKDFGSVGAQQVANVGKKVDDAGKKIESLGKNLSGLSLAAGGILVGSIKAGSDFTDAMAQVNTIADTSKVSLEDISSQILDLSNTSGIGASDIAEATYNAISAGQDTADAVNFVSNATTLAKAGFTDVGSSIDVLTTIMNAYGLEANKVGSVSDMLIQTQNKGKTTVAELASTMGKIIPTANSMGVGLDQLCAGYAIMTANGVATAESTTYMNSMLNELGKSGTGVANILKEDTGKSFQELIAEGKSVSDVLQILKDNADKNGKSFGDLWSSSEAGKAGLILLGDSAGVFNDMMISMHDSVGSTSEAFEKLETPSMKAEIAINQLKNSSIQLGQTALQALAPLIEKVAKAVEQLTTWFAGLSPHAQQVILVVLALVSALAPVLIIIGKVVQAIGTFMTFVPKIVSGFKLIGGAFKAVGAFAAANPIVLIIAAIAALVAGLVYAYQHSEKFRAIVNKAFEKIKEVVGPILDWLCKFFVETIPNALKSLGQWFSDVWDGICSFFTETIPQAFNAFIGWIKDNWQGLLLFLVNPFAGAFKLIYDNCEGFRTKVDEFVGAIKQFFVDMWEGIVTFFTKSIPEFFASVGQWFVDLYNNICETVANIIQAVGDWFSQLPERLGYILGRLVGSVIQGFLNIYNFITVTIPQIFFAIVDWFAQLPGRIAEFVTNVYTSVTQWASDMWNKAIELGTNFVTSIVDFFTSLPGKFAEWFSEVYTNVTTWAKDMADKAVEMGTNFIKSVTDFFTSLPGKIKSWFDDTVSKASSWVTDMKNKATDAGEKFIAKVVEFFTTLPGKIKQKFDEAVAKAVEWKNELGKKGKEAIQNLIDKVLEKAKNIKNDVKDIGKNIVDGIWSGITGAWEGFKKNVSNFFGGFVNGIKDSLGIHSPSRVMRDVIGKQIPAGIAVGIADNGDVVTDAMDELNDDLLTAELSVNGATINRKLSTTFAADKADTTNTKVIGLLGEIKNKLGALKVVLDNGTLVGEIIDPIDRNLAGKNTRIARGW